MAVQNLTSSELLAAGIAAAMVVILGGLYAFFLALYFMRDRRRDNLLGYLCYSLLCVFLVILALALHMSTMWRVVIALLMFGYLLSPHLIWKLTRATHDNYDTGGSTHD